MRSRRKAYELGVYFNVVKVSTMLQKLIEAAHLIEVRELMVATGKKRSTYTATITEENEQNKHD